MPGKAHSGLAMSRDLSNLGPFLRRIKVVVEKHYCLVCSHVLTLLPLS